MCRPLCFRWQRAYADGAVERLLTDDGGPAARETAHGIAPSSRPQRCRARAPPLPSPRGVGVCCVARDNRVSLRRRRRYHASPANPTPQGQGGRMANIVDATRRTSSDVFFRAYHWTMKNMRRKKRISNRIRYLIEIHISWLSNNLLDVTFLFLTIPLIVGL